MTAQSVEKAIENYVKFIRSHEKLTIIVVLAIFGFHFVNKGISAWEEHDKRQATIAQQQITAQAAANKVTEQQLADLRAQLASVTAQAESAKQQAHNTTVKQQQLDQTLPLVDVANRWAVLIGLDPSNFVATPDNKINVSEQASRQTIQKLETIPELNTDITQTNNELKACQSLSSKQDEDIKGLNAQIANVEKARTEDAKVAKDQQRKSWKSGFKYGYAAGIGTAIVIKFAKFL